MCERRDGYRRHPVEDQNWYSLVVRTLSSPPHVEHPSTWFRWRGQGSRSQRTRRLSSRVGDNFPRHNELHRREQMVIIHSVGPFYFLIGHSFEKGIALTFARLKGLQSDEVLDVQYDTVLAISYASYCPALVPSNMVDHVLRSFARRKTHNFVRFYIISRSQYRQFNSLRIPLLSNLLRPSLYIGCCAVLWGIISGLTGVT